MNFHEKLKEVFSQAIELPKEQWADFLDKACGDDVDLKAEAGSLLSNYDDSFMEDGIQFDLPTVDIGESIFNMEIVEKIAETNLSQVFKAVRHEPVRQEFAIKFLKPSLYLNEAARLDFINQIILQNRVNHPNILRIHGASTDKDRLFITMPLIHGDHLDEWLKDADQNTRLRKFYELCRAVGAAHEEQVLHLDLKPNNVIVEPDGTLHLIDFGIAKAYNENRVAIVRDGGPLSPRFAAPEQLKGGLIKASADVYSLGVIAYALFSGGKWPYEGPEPNFADRNAVLRLIEEQKPTPLNNHNASVKKDIEIIIDTCLQKKPANRYRDATALAENLLNILEKRPINERRNEIFYRTRLLFKREPKSALLLTALVIFGMVLVAKNGYDYVNNKAKNTFEVTADKYVGDIQKIMRASPQDITQLLKPIRQELDGLEDKVESAFFGSGAGHFAVGSSRLALKDYDEALEHLNQAAELGYDSDLFRLRTAMAHLGSYRKFLGRRDLLSGVDKLEQQKRAEYDRLHLTPARKQLENINDPQNTLYAKALLNYLGGDLEQALNSIEPARVEDPLSYEILSFKAFMLVQKGNRRLERNGDKSLVLNDYKMAEEIFAATRDAARCDIDNYLNLLSLYRKLVIYDQANWREWHQKGNRIYQISQTIFPNHINALLYKGYLDITTFYYTRDPFYLEETRQMAKAGLNMNHEDGDFHRLKGMYHLNAFNMATDKGSKQEHAVKTQFHLEKARKNGEDAWTLRYLITSGKNLGEVADSLGEDPTIHWQTALKHFEDCVELDPNLADAYNAAGGVNWLQAKYKIERSQDPGPDFEAAVVRIKKAIALNPGQSHLRISLGILYQEHADYIMKSGGEPGQLLAKSYDAFNRAIAQNNQTKAPNDYNWRGWVSTLEARWLVQVGEDPTTSLKLAKADFETARYQDPDNAYAWRNTGEAHLTMARYQVLKNISAKTEINKAIQAFSQTGSRLDDGPLGLIKAHLLNVESDLTNDRNPDRPLSQARQAINDISNATKMSIRHGLQVYAARLETFQAKALIQQGYDPRDAFHAAENALTQASKYNFSNIDFFLAEAHWALAVSQWQSDDVVKLRTSLDRGESAINKALNSNPRHAEALAIKGLLLFERIRLSSLPTQRMNWLYGSQSLLEKACERNKLLRNRLQPTLTKIDAQLNPKS